MLSPTGGELVKISERPNADEIDEIRLISP